MVQISLTMKALLEKGFKLNFAKCKFAQRKVTYLGHIIGENCIQPTKNNLTAIKNFRIWSKKDLLHVSQFLVIELFLSKVLNYSSADLSKNSLKISTNFLLEIPFLVHSRINNFNQKSALKFSPVNFSKTMSLANDRLDLLAVSSLLSTGSVIRSSK